MRQVVPYIYLLLNSATGQSCLQHKSNLTQNTSGDESQFSEATSQCPKPWVCNGGGVSLRIKNNITEIGPCAFIWDIYIEVSNHAPTTIATVVFIRLMNNVKAIQPLVTVKICL